MNKLYVDAVGLVVVADCGREITGATGITIDILKPDGTTAVWVATAYSTTEVSHTTVAGDIDLPGRYRGQVHLTYGTWTGDGESFEFTIYDKYQ